MKGRLLKGVESVTEIHHVLHNHGPGFITECLNWISSLIVAVFNTIFGSIAEIFGSLGHLLVSGFLAVCSAVWSPIIQGLHWIAHLIHTSFDSCVGSIAEVFRSFGHLLVSSFWAVCYAAWSPISGVLHWIAHLIHTSFDTCVGSIAEVFRSFGHLLISGFWAMCDALRSLISGVLHWIAHLDHTTFDVCLGFSIDLYDGVTRGVEHVVDFTMYWVKQFVETCGYVIAAIGICIAAILILNFCWPLIKCVVIAIGQVIDRVLSIPIVVIVQCIGFTAPGIIQGSYAAGFMALYCGKVAVGSACAVLQRIGAKGVVAFSR